MRTDNEDVIICLLKSMKIKNKAILYYYVTTNLYKVIDYLASTYSMPDENVLLSKVSSLKHLISLYEIYIKHSTIFCHTVFQKRAYQIHRQEDDHETVQKFGLYFNVIKYIFKVPLNKIREQIIYFEDHHIPINYSFKNYKLLLLVDEDLSEWIEYKMNESLVTTNDYTTYLIVPTKKRSRDIECSICYKETDLCTKCNHLVCKFYAMKINKCPVCRQEITFYLQTVNNI